MNLSLIARTSAALAGATFVLLPASAALAAPTDQTVTTTGSGNAVTAIDRSSAKPSTSTVADTRFEVRNETNKDGNTPKTFELWAHLDGNKGNEKVKVATLAPGQSWNNTAHNSWAYDHNLQIVVDGVSRMRLIAHNPAAYTPYLVVYYPSGHSENSESSKSLSQNESFVMNDTGMKVWTWRGADTDSGHWYQANTKNMVASIWEIPERTYEISKDPFSGGTR